VRDINTFIKWIKACTLDLPGIRPYARFDLIIVINMLKFPSLLLFLVFIMPGSQTQAFPVGKAFHEGYLRVSPIHEIWFAEYGNPVVIDQ